MDEHQRVTDEFRGAKVWWAASKVVPPARSSVSFYPEKEKRYYKLIFHKKYREIMTDNYLEHPMWSHIARLILQDNREESSKVTLSGLLNFIDGLWSACGGERLIVFTTNYVEKLDPALIRRGRMDKHIEFSYCSFKAFKVLANNYLGLETHPLFEMIQQSMEETNITPADVAENLMPKSPTEDAEKCLLNLI
ncbi:unnamed protein product, partial [Vitis vinifera]